LNLWDDRPVRLTLSAEGRDALGEYFGGTYADVVVQATDSMGLWTLHGAERIDSLTLVLVRWEYIQTARQDVPIVMPVPAKKTNLIGFRP